MSLTQHFEVTHWVGYNFFCVFALLSSCFAILSAAWLLTRIGKTKIHSSIKLLLIFVFNSSAIQSASVLKNYSSYIVQFVSQSDPLVVLMGECSFVRNVYLVFNIFVTLSHLIFAIVVFLGTINVSSKRLLQAVVLILSFVAFLAAIAIVLFLLKIKDPDELQPHCLSISGSSLGDAFYSYMYLGQAVIDGVVCAVLFIMVRVNRNKRANYNTNLSTKLECERNLTALFQSAPVVAITAALTVVSIFGAFVLRHFQESMTPAEYKYYAYFFFIGPHIPLLQNIIFIVIFRKQWNKVNKVANPKEDGLKADEQLNKAWKCQASKF